MSWSPLAQKLPRAFYSRPTLRVARDLLGKYLVRRIGRSIFVGKIVEVEAYCGSIDPASHAFKGKTPRNAVMFSRAGHLYVYFTYGMYFCANVVTERTGKAGAVLLRAVEPLQGVSRMITNRNKRNGVKPRKAITGRFLTNGPAKLCQAFGIGREENGADLLGIEIYVTRGTPVRHSEVERSKRIGIRMGRDKKWRFFLKNNRWVSKAL